jgi:hypothetical protein
MFTILRSSSVLQPSAKLTYADVHIGIQNMIVCIQMVPIACFFHCAYPVKPYTIARRLQVDARGQGPMRDHERRLEVSYQGGPWGVRAWTLLVNPVENLRDIRDIFRMIRTAQEGVSCLPALLFHEY